MLACGGGVWCGVCYVDERCLLCSAFYTWGHRARYHRVPDWVTHQGAGAQTTQGHNQNTHATTPKQGRSTGSTTTQPASSLRTTL